MKYLWKLFMLTSFIGGMLITVDVYKAYVISSKLWLYWELELCGLALVDLGPSSNCSSNGNLFNIYNKNCCFFCVSCWSTITMFFFHTFYVQLLVMIFMQGSLPTYLPTYMYLPTKSSKLLKKLTRHVIERQQHKDKNKSEVGYGKKIWNSNEWQTQVNVDIFNWIKHLLFNRNIKIFSHASKLGCR